MWIKAIAALLLAGTILAGAALVSKAESRGGTRGLSSPSSASGEGVETISHGESVLFEDHVTAGPERTIFMFTADW